MRPGNGGSALIIELSGNDEGTIGAGLVRAGFEVPATIIISAMLPIATAAGIIRIFFMVVV